MLLAEERPLRLQRLVVERLLHQRLAVVEGTRHAQRLHVVAEAAELVRLARRHAAVGIEHHHAQAGLAMEGGGHGGAGVARWRRGWSAAARPARAGQRGGEEARAEIPEGPRWDRGTAQHGIARRANRRSGQGKSKASAQIASSCSAARRRRRRGAAGARRRPAGWCPAQTPGDRAPAGAGGTYRAAVGERGPRRWRPDSVVGVAPPRVLTKSITAPPARAGHRRDEGFAGDTSVAESLLHGRRAEAPAAADSNQANTLGPAPEMLAPSAPCSSAACFTAPKPAISGAGAVPPARRRGRRAPCAASPRKQPASTRARWALCATNSRSS